MATDRPRPRAKKTPSPVTGARKKAPERRAGGAAKPAPTDPALTDVARMTYGMTFHGKNSYGEFWVKFDANDGLRDGETPDEAKKRLQEFVEDAIIEKIEDLGSA